MGRLGFEPRTNRLKAECSTAELATRVRHLHAVFYVSIGGQEGGKSHAEIHRWF